MNDEVSSVCRIYVDARCLQDDRFRDRGIGQHVASLLAGAHTFAPPGIAPELIACIDRSLKPLEPHHDALFDAKQSFNVAPTPGSVLLQLSPMTHSPHPLRRILADASIRGVAIVYDFIPLEFPHDYLQDSVARREYLSNLAVLNDYDRFVSISDYSSRQLQRNIGVPVQKCHVSGVAVRDSVIRPASVRASGARYCLVIGGGDKRKNVELPIVAHARSAALREAEIGLKIVGHYTQAARKEFRALHLREGGDPHLLEFVEGVSDAALALLYQGAQVTVCPSRTEGFSIPVVEANANGCPVIVANCDAQVELMPMPEFQFRPDDMQRVAALMESFIDERTRQRAIKRQGKFWLRFESKAVQARFWEAFHEEVEADEGLDLPKASAVGSPYVSRNLKPRLAIASPVPPARSGVADFTVATMAAVAKHADLYLYTETEGRFVDPAFKSVRPLSSEPYVGSKFDGVISVLGNSHLHHETFKLLLDHGGASIAHDARMLHFYVGVLGEERARGVASHEMGREVSSQEIHGWLANQRSMPILFLSEILEASQPTFVHSPVTREIVADLYGRETVHLPFAVYRKQSPEFAGARGRSRARQFLGIGEGTRLLICLGDLVPDKALEECMWTASVLANWGVPVQLAFVGNSEPQVVAYVKSIAELMDLAGRVTCTGGMVDERTYQAYLAAADAAIQLRTYKFGGLSGAMLDGIAAGIPTVSNDHLAEAMESPAYVARIPDGLSPVLAAERLLEIFEQDNRKEIADQQKAFLREHSVDAYAERLMTGMGLA